EELVGSGLDVHQLHTRCVEDAELTGERHGQFDTDRRHRVQRTEVVADESFVPCHPKRAGRVSSPVVTPVSGVRAPKHTVRKPTCGADPGVRPTGRPAAPPCGAAGRGCPCGPGPSAGSWAPRAEVSR